LKDAKERTVLQLGTSGARLCRCDDFLEEKSRGCPQETTLKLDHRRFGKGETTTANRKEDGKNSSAAAKEAGRIPTLAIKG